MNILLINQYAGNKGDRAVLFAMCNLISRIAPAAHISVSTSHPETWDNYDYYKSNNITFVPSAWDYRSLDGVYWSILKKLKKYTFTILRETYLRGLNLTKALSNPIFYKALKNSDIVISVGGHHYTTILSSDLVCSINFDTAVVLSQTKNFYCFSQSFGPFNFKNNRNKIFTQRLLNDAKLLLPREQSSFLELKKMNIPNQKIALTYESVLSLNSLFSEYVPISSRKKRVGIAIYATQHRSPDMYEKYVSDIAHFCDYVISKNFDIIFFPMEIKGSAPDDRPMISTIIDKIKGHEHVSVINNDLQTKEHLLEVANCQLFLGHKTHSTIFALATGTPLIGIAYHPKTIEFMKQFQMGNYAIDDSILSKEKLISLFDEILPNLELVGKNSFAKAKELASVIESDFRNILER